MRCGELGAWVAMNPVGELPSAADRPGLEQDGDPWVGEIAVPDDPAEFANSIDVGDRPRKRRPGPAVASGQATEGLDWCSWGPRLEDQGTMDHVPTVTTDDSNPNLDAPRVR